jgi:hypothetical protein
LVDKARQQVHPREFRLLLDLVGENFFDFIQQSTANSQQSTVNSIDC